MNKTSKTLKEKVKKLINLMESNTSTKWDFALEHTYDCIVTEDGTNRHSQDCYDEVYTGGKIWHLVNEIKEELN
tara:strand:- start:405 stop:626 length:222 start_codon:yes stop_codon:yes gene_type:complete